LAPLRLLADATADAILFPVEPGILVPGEMAAVPCCHAPLLRADAMIGGMQAGSLRTADLTIPDLLVNARILIGQPAVDLHAPRVSAKAGAARQASETVTATAVRTVRIDCDIKGAPGGTIAGVALRPICGLAGVNNVAGTGPVSIITKS